MKFLRLCALYSCVLLFFIVYNSVAFPLAEEDPTLLAMHQVPQWHCMRYRKFELIRRCRSYKNSLRLRRN
ncbi:hypothetical protein GWI33_017648 [Rhynchophorus ferrugineus]|uniref:Uncharacterized protein n=1 Tax=Rhynchophorus ferrugineus TaxID=354439 RepID=A0A834HV33_RHYFE|nr:hypothetical protein GWI33_017648 [Rhynchophorus ferrugineus]